MLESLPIVLTVGTLLGFLSGLGIGGGSLLIVWLTVVLNTDPTTARSMNLLFFIPSAVIASIIRCRQHRIKFSHILPAAIPGCIAAGTLSLIAASLDVELLKKLFGVLLIAAGMRELIYKKKKEGASN